jgi:hypothetical protein
LETLLIILAAGAAIISALIYPAHPKCTLAVSISAVIIGASALTVLMVGPKDYMLRLPSSMAPGLHPYVLGACGMFLLTLGGGGIIGLSARWLASRRIPRS